MKGVGKATARLLIEEFGEDALRVMEEEPEKLTRLRGVSPKRARSISEAFRKQMGMRRLLDFLSGVAYAGEGKIKKVAANTYIITPYHVDIEGDLIDELENNGLYF